MRVNSNAQTCATVTNGKYFVCHGVGTAPAIVSEHDSVEEAIHAAAWLPDSWIGRRDGARLDETLTVWQRPDGEVERPPLQILRADAGFYIGVLDVMGVLGSRESVEFWLIAEEAAQALRTGNWTLRGPEYAFYREKPRFGLHEAGGLDHGR